ncbi:MAG: hypothetical protein KGL92_04595 [Gammaproteobacteria bacterium]|nr:hypothetical protein [Gammaproteobacteria bacterium]
MRTLTAWLSAAIVGVVCAGAGAHAATGGAPSPGRAPASARGPAVADLPLIVVPAAPGKRSPWFAVFLSGDGGWAMIDRRIAAALAAQGLPVVGWNSLRYFWRPRTPEEASRDLDRLVRHYSREFGKSRVLLIGFSQGADTLPFMVNRLPPATRALVGLTALLGLSDSADFAIHVSNWLGKPPAGLPTAPELARWRGSSVLCIYGATDRDAACTRAPGPQGTTIEMPGGHHFDGRYAAIADRILAHLPR